MSQRVECALCTSSVVLCRQQGAKHIKECSLHPVHSLHACEHDTSLWSSVKLQRLIMEPADTQAEKHQETHAGRDDEKPWWSHVYLLLLSRCSNLPITNMHKHQMNFILMQLVNCLRTITALNWASEVYYLELNYHSKDWGQ